RRYKYLRSVLQHMSESTSLFWSEQFARERYRYTARNPPQTDSQSQYIQYLHYRSQPAFFRQKFRSIGSTGESSYRQCALLPVLLTEKAACSSGAYVSL
ncbi:hypothetical protein OW894_27660, partial [Klebsiella pneumoniae]